MNAAASPQRDDHYREDIEGLRAIAVGAVLAFHFFPGHFPGGYLGVDIFFVISGYLISGVILRRVERGQFTFVDFYSRRIRRLFPAMLVVVGTCAVAGAILMFAFEFERFARHVAASLFYVENFLLASELGYFDHDSKAKPLLHFWSLAVEEQFYIVWPILLLATARFRSGPFIACLVVAIASLAWTIGPAAGDPAAFFSPLARAWELAIGGLVAMTAARSRRMLSDAPRHALSIASVLVLAACAFWAIPAGWHPGPATLVPVLATAILLVCGSGAIANARLLSLPPAVWVGQISYSLYLWHWPMLAFPVFVTGTVPSPAMRLALLVLSFTLAAATFWAIERPLQRRMDLRRTAAALFAGSVLVLAATLGIMAAKNARSDGQDAAIEAQLEGPLWAFVDNRACAERYTMPPDHPFCILSRDAEPTMVLAGNSFANHFYYGLTQSPATRGHTVLSYGSCNPLLPRPFSWTDCRMQEDAARRSSRLQVILASALWPEFDAKGQMIDPVSQDRVGDGAPDATAFATIVRDWLGTMTRPETRIVLVGPKPELPYDVATCFDRPFFAAPNDCRIERAEADRRIRGMKAILEDIASGSENIQYVDVLDFFCDATMCDMIGEDGLPLLRDNGHLSRVGSERMMAYILDTPAGDSLRLEPGSEGARQ